jgi:hypothetical protein
MEETDQTIAPSANGKSAPFEGEDVGSIPTGASTFKYRFVPVPGKPFTYIPVDKITGEPFNVGAAIEASFMAGNCQEH